METKSFIHGKRGTRKRKDVLVNLGPPTDSFYEAADLSSCTAGEIDLEVLCNVCLTLSMHEKTGALCLRFSEKKAEGKKASACQEADPRGGAGREETYCRDMRGNTQQTAGSSGHRIKADSDGAPINIKHSLEELLGRNGPVGQRVDGVHHQV